MRPWWDINKHRRPSLLTVDLQLLALAQAFMCLPRLGWRCLYMVNYSCDTGTTVSTVVVQYNMIVPRTERLRVLQRISMVEVELLSSVCSICAPLGRCVLLLVTLIPSVRFRRASRTGLSFYSCWDSFCLFLLSRQFFFSHDFLPLGVLGTCLRCVRRRWFWIGLTVATTVETSTMIRYRNQLSITQSVCSILIQVRSTTVAIRIFVLSSH